MRAFSRGATTTDSLGRQSQVDNAHYKKESRSDDGHLTTLRNNLVIKDELLVKLDGYRRVGRWVMRAPSLNSSSMNTQIGWWCPETGSIGAWSIGSGMLSRDGPPTDWRSIDESAAPEQAMRLHRLPIDVTSTRCCMRSIVTSAPTSGPQLRRRRLNSRSRWGIFRRHVLCVGE